MALLLFLMSRDPIKFKRTNTQGIPPSQRIKDVRCDNGEMGIQCNEGTRAALLQFSAVSTGEKERVTGIRSWAFQKESKGARCLNIPTSQGNGIV